MAAEEMKPLAAGATGLTLKVLIADPEKASFAKKAFNDKSPWSGGPEACTSTPRNLPNANDDKFRQELRSVKPWQDGISDFTKLSLFVREFNEESARISFSTRAIEVAQESLSMIARVGRFTPLRQP
jgi:hypothetical protein